MPPPDLPHRPSGQTMFLAASVVASVLIVVLLLVLSRRGPDGRAEAAGSRLRLGDIPFDGAQAYQYLKQLCAIGPRRSGSAGMADQQKLLADHFQRFRALHPLDGSEVHMANLIVHWAPASKQRIMLCAHYDTLPLPMRDPQNPQGVFLGANDNGSGVAILMELGREMAQSPGSWNVDFVFLDGEEHIFSEKDRYFLGSEFFARTYAESKPPYRYRWGVLLDMVGQTNLRLYQERHSVSWPDTRPLVQSLWATAARLGVGEFIARVDTNLPLGIRDDHLPLHDLGGIPTCDVIDMDYPPWHTQGDTPDKCSALSLAKVGWVLREWLKKELEARSQESGARSKK
jgi:hypothetical protein